MPIRLMLVDDHPVVLGGLTSALSEQRDLEVVARATSRAEAEAALREQAIDVALVDIRLPDGSGLELISAFRSRPAWIVLSSFEAPQYLAAALGFRAAGYLLKTAPLGDVVDAIRRVAQGGTAFESRQLRAAAQGAAGGGLSDRERSILRGVLAGRSNDEVAAELRVARKTVEAHLTRLFSRFGVGSRTELALRAEREGWLETPDRERG